MGCSSSSASSGSADAKNNEFVVDDISDPTKVKAPIEVAHPTYSLPASQRNGSGHDSGTSSGKQKKKANNQIATTAADTVTATSSNNNHTNNNNNDARSRYALQDDPPPPPNDDDIPAGGGLPGLGGLPTFQPRRYEDVHANNGGNGDDDEEDDPKPQGDQVVTDLFRRYADNARGGVRPKTVVMKPPSSTFGTFSSNSRPNSLVPVVGEEDDTTTDATVAVAPPTAASTASGTGAHMDDNDHTEVSSSRIGGITMNPARRSHSESSRRQRSRHSTTTSAAHNVPVPGAVMDDTVATVVGTAKASSRHDDDDEFG